MIKKTCPSSNKYLNIKKKAVVASFQSGKIMPKNTYKAIIKKEENWWIGWIQEIPGVNCQEATREELLDSLQITLSEALELNPSPK